MPPEKREKKKNDRCCYVCEYLMMKMVMMMRKMMMSTLMKSLRSKMRYVKKRLRRREEGRERERNNTSAMFARRCLDVRKIWPDTCAFTRTRDRTNVMCARSVFVNLVI